MAEKKLKTRGYTCKKCGTPFHFQVHRSRLMKMLSAIIPLKKFYCAKCKRASYVLLKEESV